MAFGTVTNFLFIAVYLYTSYLANQYKYSYVLYHDTRCTRVELSRVTRVTICKQVWTDL